MRHLYKLKQEKINQFNTFQVFEGLYGSRSVNRPDELDMPPVKSQRLVLWAWLSAMLLLFFLALTFHPLLSYVLKTPYPLVVINDNNLSPLLKPGDIILSQGIISYQQIKPGDLIIFYSLDKNSNQKYFFVRQVKAIQADQFIVSGLHLSAEQIVDFKNVTGRVIGNQHPLRLPLISELGLLWHKIR